jgi:hypothetical protein
MVAMADMLSETVDLVINIMPQLQGQAAEAGVAGAHSLYMAVRAPFMQLGEVV